MMHKRRWMSWALLVVFAFVAMTGGCGGGGGGEKTPDDGNTLTVTPASLTLEVGKSGTLTAKDFMGGLTWLSGDDSIATVSSSGSATAVVTAVAAGTTDITVIDDSGAEATCRVTVTAGGTPAPGPEPKVDYSKIVPGIPLLDGEFIEVESVKLKNDVYTLLDADSHVDDNGVLVLSRGNTAQESEKDSYIGADELTAGSVLIVPPGDNLPSGSQGRISSLKVDGEKVYVTLDEVSASEIFEDLVLKWSVALDSRTLVSENEILRQGVHAAYVETVEINIPIGDIATVTGSAQLGGNYNAGREDFTLEMTLRGDVTLNANLYQPAVSKTDSYNIPFTIGGVPMGFKASIGASAKVKTPVKLTWSLEKKYTTRVWKNSSGGFEKDVTDSTEFKAPFSEGFDIESWITNSEFVLTPQITAYLYAGVEGKAGYASAGISGQVGNDFTLSSFEDAEQEKYGDGWGIYSQFSIALKALARTGAKVTLFKIIDIGTDYSLEHLLFEKKFDPVFLYKVLPIGGPADPDPTGDLITKLSKTWRPVSVKKAIQGDATTYTYTQISPVTNKGVPYNSTLSFSFEVTSDNGYVFDPGGELYVVNNSYSPPYQIIGWDPAAVFNALFVSENRLERSLPGVIAMSFELLPSGQVKYTENLYDGRIMEIIFELVN